MTRKEKRARARRRNRLLLILICVAVVAALAFILIRTMKPSGSSVSVQSAEATSRASAAAAVSSPAADGSSALDGSQADESSAEPSSTEEPEPTPVPDPEYYTISLVGDCTLSASSDKVTWGIGYQSVIAGDFTYPFAKTVDLLNDDYLTVANLECDLSDSYYTSPTYEWFTFLSDADYAQILSNGSVEFVTLANNHTLDFGEQAYKDTETSLDAVGVKYAGEDETLIYQVDGGPKIGIYCMYNQLTTNALELLNSSAQEELITESRERLDAAVSSLKEQGAEYLLTCLHMGTEGAYEPTDVQTDMCRYAVDAGFNAVYCTHAHRLQPAEMYNGGVIFYGMGNWTFGGHTNPGNGTDPGAYDTGIGKITLKAVGSTVTTDSWDFIPCCISSSAAFPLNANTLNNYQPVPYEEGSDAYARAMSMINGTYEGANYTVNYENVLSQMYG